MRRGLPLSLTILMTLQAACSRDEATAPHSPPLTPSLQAVTGEPSRIAFRSDRDGNSEIYIMNADGSALMRLTNDPAFDFWPRLSPDGTQIAFGSRRNDATDVYVMTADGSNVTRLTTEGGTEPSWSPDGRQILFTSTRDGNSEIYVMNADGSAPARLTNDPSADESPNWSPDGRQILFTRARRAWVMGADGSAQTQLATLPVYYPRWSPDGQHIGFTTTGDGDYEIYVMGADGSAPTRLTNNPGLDFYPSWSPDGSQIAFERAHWDGAREIYVMNADGSNPTQVTPMIKFSETNAEPTWGPGIPDVTPPQLTLPSDFGVPPERWFGAVVGYGGVSATDNRDPAPTVACTPPSGATFAIGTTEVQCTATDRSGNTTAGSFRLTVRDQIAELGFVVTTLESLINSPGATGTAALQDVLAEVQAARQEFARAPIDRDVALRHLQSATGSLYTARDAGELSTFGFNVLAPRLAGMARLTADQAIAEAKARGGNSDAIADAEDSLAKGDASRAAGTFDDAVAQYRKACRIGTAA